MKCSILKIQNTENTDNKKYDTFNLVTFPYLPVHVFFSFNPIVPKRHFFVLWYWIDGSPAIFKMLISKEIVDGK